MTFDPLNFKYPEKIRFKCKRCALCCGDTEQRVRTILLMKIEADLISEETSKNIDEFAERIENSEPYTYRMKKNTERKCIFLKGKTCTIYQIRPLICRFYPFEFKNVGSSGYAFIPT